MSTLFDGYRVYNGCPDSTMQARLDAEAQLMAELTKRQPEAHVTYFPVEEQYMAHVWGRPLSGMEPTRVQAIRAALAKAAIKPE